MGTHVSINAQELCCKLLTIAGFPSTLRSTYDRGNWKWNVPTKRYQLSTWCYRITKPGDGTLGKLIWEVSTARSKMKTNDSLYWFRLFQTRRSDIHVGWIIIVASGSNWRTRMKRNGEVVSPYPSPLALPQLPWLFFSCSLSLRLPWEQRPSIPSPLFESHFVLRACVKTTGSKNDLHGVEPPYLLPLLPLSSNIIRVIVRNVPVWESYITHLSHDRLRAA